MITKNDIKTNINYWKSLGKLDPAFINIYNTDEFQDVCGSTLSDLFGLYGEFDFVICYSDFPDYLFLDKNLRIDDLDSKINDWLEEIKAI